MTPQKLKNVINFFACGYPIYPGTQVRKILCRFQIRWNNWEQMHLEKVIGRKLLKSNSQATAQNIENLI